MAVKLHVHKLLYRTRHSDLRSRYSSEVELLCPFWLSSLLVDCSCWYLIRRQFTCLLRTTLPPRRSPPLWRSPQCPPLQQKGMLPVGALGLGDTSRGPASVYCTVVIVAAFSSSLFWAPLGNACSMQLWLPSTSSVSGRKQALEIVRRLRWRADGRWVFWLMVDNWLIFSGTSFCTLPGSSSLDMPVTLVSLKLSLWY